MSRAYRLLMLVQHVRRSSRLRSKDLAERLGCTERQVFRDLRELSSIGIPIYFDKDGYKLHSEGFIPPLSLSAEEALTLSIGLSSPAIQRIPRLAKAAQTLLQKLKVDHATVFSSRGRERIHFSSLKRTDLNLSPKVYDQLSVAITKQKVVAVDYAAAEGLVSERLHPYLLFFRKNHWYLAAWAENPKEVRLFRVDRIRNCTVLPEKFVLAKGFDLESYLQSAWELFPGQTIHEVRARFSPLLARVVTDTMRHPTQQVVRNPDGSVVWSIRVANLDEVRWWLMGFGSGIEVLEPVELRRKILEEARKMAILYDGKTDRNGQGDLV